MQGRSIERPRIAVLQRYYLPGFRAGGPIRSVSNLCMALEEDYDFRVISLDRDVGDKQPYSGIATGVWRQFPGGNVMYLDAQRIRSDLVKLLTTEHFDAWYANSFFDPCFSILPAVLRNTKLRGDIPMIVAPRGEFNPGALSLKGARKRIYLTISRLLNIYRGTYWHATNGIEQEQVSRLMNIGPGDVFLVNNFGAASAGYSRIEQKRVGRHGPPRRPFLHCNSPTQRGGLASGQRPRASRRFHRSGPSRASSATYRAVDEPCQPNSPPRIAAAFFRFPRR
jgi:hypothetical protein